MKGNKMSTEMTQEIKESGELTEVESVVNPTIQPDAKKMRALTRKEVEYLKRRVAGMTQRQAVTEVYDVKPGVANSTLDNMAGRIEKRKPVLAVLQAHEEEAQETIAEVMRTSREMSKSGGKEGAAYARVAVDSGNSILDRLHGKAKQSVDVTSTAVNLNIDLTLDDE